MINCGSGFRTNDDASCKSLRTFLTHLTAIIVHAYHSSQVSGLIPDDSVYELPDGTPVNVNEHPDLYVVPEAMFMEGPLTSSKTDAPALIDVEGNDQDQVRSS